MNPTTSFFFFWSWFTIKIPTLQKIGNNKLKIKTINKIPIKKKELTYHVRRIEVVEAVEFQNALRNEQFGGANEREFWNDCEMKWRMWKWERHVKI